MTYSASGTPEMPPMVTSGMSVLQIGSSRT